MTGVGTRPGFDARLRVIGAMTTLFGSSSFPRFTGVKSACSAGRSVSYRDVRSSVAFIEDPTLSLSARWGAIHLFKNRSGNRRARGRHFTCFGLGGEPALQEAVDRPGAAAADHDRDGHRDGEQVVLEAFAGLLARPVHKEADLAVNHGHRTGHHGGDAEGHEPAAQAEGKGDRAE